MSDEITNENIEKTTNEEITPDRFIYNPNTTDVEGAGKVFDSEGNEIVEDPAWFE